MMDQSRSQGSCGDVSSLQSEDVNRSHGEGPLCKIQSDDSFEDLSYSPYIPNSFSAKEETEKSKKSVLMKPWAGLFTRWKKTDSESHSSCSGEIKILPNGTRCSPPVTPLPYRKHWDAQNAVPGDIKPNSPPDSTGQMYNTLAESELTSIHPAEYYAEKLEVYKLKYSYLKSWPGLLRLLAGLELLFGAMVFACVCAYVQRDSEWSNLYNPVGNMQGYNRPMTPLVLVVVGFAWILTIILLVLGLTMYYRTILLDSKWWPLTEAIMNLVIFLLYMTAGIVYVNDLNRGGLCFMTIGINPILSNLCRVEGGQMAGTAFIFINMIMYLISFMVCLRMWRHEAARRQREAMTSKENCQHKTLEFTSNMGSSSTRSKNILFKDEMDQSFLMESKEPHTSKRAEVPEILTGAIPIGHIPKPKVIADYIIKYPEIHSVEDREQYKAVFNDQYQEYKELHMEITATLMKFQELDNTMSQLLNNPSNPAEHRRIKDLLKVYKGKRNDPYFLEKKERCEYLKAKLSHIKMRIRIYDQYFMTNDRNY